MDESDSDSEGPTFEDDGERYPLEGKFIDSSDRARILEMNEIEREQVLAERAQEIERDRQNRALRQLLKSRETENKQNKKRKAGASDLQEDPRKTQRQRTKLGGGKVGEASSGIDSLKRARAEKDDRQRRRQEDKERNKGRSTARDDYSDADADGDSEVEWDDGKSKNKRSKSPDYRDAEPATLADIQKVRVGRSRFAQVCFYPGFDEAITGCFVRISIGMDKETGQNIYRMGIIKGRYQSWIQVLYINVFTQASLRIDHTLLSLPLASISRPHNMSALPMAKLSETGHSLAAPTQASLRFVDGTLLVIPGLTFFFFRTNGTVTRLPARTRVLLFLPSQS